MYMKMVWKMYSNSSIEKGCTDFVQKKFVLFIAKHSLRSFFFFFCEIILFWIGLIIILDRVIYLTDVSYQTIKPWTKYTSCNN
jgi:hypothetical protein